MKPAPEVRLPAPDELCTSIGTLPVTHDDHVYTAHLMLSEAGDRFVTIAPAADAVAQAAERGTLPPRARDLDQLLNHRAPDAWIRMWGSDAGFCGVIYHADVMPRPAPVADAPEVRRLLALACRAEGYSLTH